MINKYINMKSSENYKILEMTQYDLENIIGGSEASNSLCYYVGYVLQSIWDTMGSDTTCGQWLQ